MFLARVVSPVVSTAKHPSYKGRKLFLVRKLSLDYAPENEDTLAIDLVDAGVGDIVLVSQEGGAARRIIGDNEAPIRSIIVGIVERVEIYEN